MVKILFMAPQSIHTKKWVELFNNDDFEILVVSFDSGNKDVLNGLPSKTIENKFGKFGYLFSIPEFKKILNEFKPDIIHAHFITSYGYIGSKLKFHPLVLSAWGSDITLAEGNIFRRMIVKNTLNSADYVNFAGEYLKKISVSLIGFDPKKPNDVFQYGVNFEEISKYRTEFEKRDRNIIVSPRGFSEVYNFENQILAMKLVNEKRPDLKLLMYGGGDTNKSKNIIHELGLDDVVQVVGKIPQNLLWQSMGKAQCVISVPFRDGTPLSLLEAMALGSFPIVSNIPPNKEWIEDKKTGLVVNPNSPEDISRAILTAFENDQLAKNAFDVNIEIVKSKADYKKNMEKLSKIYFSLKGR